MGSIALSCRKWGFASHKKRVLSSRKGRRDANEFMEPKGRAVSTFLGQDGCALLVVASVCHSSDLGCMAWEPLWLLLKYLGGGAVLFTGHPMPPVVDFQILAAPK